MRVSQLRTRRQKPLRYGTAASALALLVSLVLVPRVSLAQSADEKRSPVSVAERATASAPEVVSRPPPTRLRLSDGAELDRIIELYMAGDYQRCSGELSGFLSPSNLDRFTDPNVIERGRLYYSTCSLLLGDRESARQGLRAALEENPLMPSPDSLTFPPPLISLFLEVRDEVQQLIADREREQVLRLRRENEIARRKAEERRSREEQLEELASHETVIKKNSRFIASLPFGAGQFQNQNPALGSVFLVGQSAAVISAITALSIRLAIENRKERQAPEREAYNRQTLAAYQTMKWSVYTGLGLYALSVLEAQLSFKAEIKIQSRKRALPPELTPEVEPASSLDTTSFSLAPVVTPLAHGAYFGLDCRF